MKRKEFTNDETIDVAGGFGPLGMTLGAIAGGIGQMAAGADAKGIAAGIVLVV